MSDGPDIQHKPAFKGEHGFGFDDAGERVPVAWTAPGDAPDGGGVDVEQVLDLLMLGNADAQRVGERAILLAYLMPRCARRPQNLRQLGARIGCSHEAARQKLDRLRADFAKEITDFTTNA